MPSSFISRFSSSRFTRSPEQINNKPQQKYQHGISYEYFKLQSHFPNCFVLFLVLIRFSALRTASYAYKGNESAQENTDGKHDYDHLPTHKSSSFSLVPIRCLTSTFPSSWIVKKMHQVICCTDCILNRVQKVSFPQYRSKTLGVAAFARGTGSGHGLYDAAASPETLS